MAAVVRMRANASSAQGLNVGMSRTDPPANSTVESFGSAVAVRIAGKDE